MGLHGQWAKMQEKYNLSMPQDEGQRYVDQELGKVVERLEQKCEPCEGVVSMLQRSEK